MTFWLVILFTMMAVLSPLLWLRPSPRDKRLLVLRQYAGRDGVVVKFTQSPLYNPPAALIGYRYRYPQQRPGPRFVMVRDAYASAVLNPAYDGWRWRIEPYRPLSEEAKQYLEQVLESLPGDALVLESTQTALSFWWEESLSVEQFKQSNEALTSLRDALADAGEQIKKTSSAL